MDTKGTKEIIKALNPKSELRAVTRNEERFIERSQLNRDTKRNSVFRRGINYLGKKMGNATRYVGRKTGNAASYVGRKTGNTASYVGEKGMQGLRGTRNAASYVGQKTGNAFKYLRGNKTRTARGTREVRKGSVLNSLQE